jgi:hypothetical protein
MVQFNGKPEPYHNHVALTLTADGDYTLNHLQVPEGCILQVAHLTGIGNLSGAAEYTYLGFRRGNLEIILHSDVNTSAVGDLVRLRQPMYLIENDQPFARFTAGNDTEVISSECHGILWYLNK